MANISVIVPVYMVEQYLKQCVDSILSQTFSDFDLILVDDGTSDKSSDICDEYTNNDKRVTVIHQKNQGLSGARNTGIEWALMENDSEWITFIDSDDFVVKDYLGFLFDILNNNNADISMCNSVRFENESETLSYDKITIDESFVISGRDACIEAYKDYGCVDVVTWGKLYRKSIFQHLRFPIGKIHEDQVVTPRALYNSEKIVVSNEKKYMYRIRSDSIMRLHFSVKKFDGVEAEEQCITYFEKEGDDELVYLAGKCKNVINAKLVLEAYSTNCQMKIPHDFKMSRYKAWKTLYKILPSEKFEWFISLYHPKMVLPFEYYKKIKSILSF